MKSNRFATLREMPNRRGALLVVGSVIIGLLLARFFLISPFLSITILAAGTIITLTLLIRRVDLLIFGWVVLSTFLWFIVYRFTPIQYHPIIGRGIFWGLLLCAILAWFVNIILERRQFRPIQNVGVKTTVLFFILWSIVTLVASTDLLVSVKKLVQICIALITSYMFYDFLSQDEKNIRKLFNFISIAVILVSCVTVVTGIESLIAGVPVYKRISLWFTNPNVLGSFLFICSPLLISSGFDFRPIKRFRFVFIFLMLTALFFSFHRTSWVAAAVSLGFLVWKSRMRVPTATALIAAVFLSGLLFPVVGENFYDYLTGQEYSGRTEIWKASWNTTLDHPILGTGLGNSVGVIDQYIETPWLQNQETHNVYLQNTVEMGFVSLSILLVFYVIFLRSSEQIEMTLQSRYLRSVVRGSTAAFLGLFIHGMFGNYGILSAFSAGEFYVLLPYIILALPFAAQRLGEEGAALKTAR